jgi:hypothetical protein
MIELYSNYDMLHGFIVTISIIHQYFLHLYQN